MITYHIRSQSIDTIPKALSLLRRRLIRVIDFSAHTDETGIFDIMITITIPQEQAERFLHLFEKIYEIDTIEWWFDTEHEDDV